MAHFAEINENNDVLRTIVVSNADILDENGIEQEHLGVAICVTVAGAGMWKQTSYNNNFRKLFGQPGMKYAPDKDVFYNPVAPFPSWVLDANYDWQAPTAKPDDGNDYYWDEESLVWVLIPNQESE